jgi:hypothetical protein
MDHIARLSTRLSIHVSCRTGGDRRIWRLVIVAMFALLAMNVDAPASEPSRLLEEKLPANTLAFAAVDDVAATCAAWQATQSGKLLAGELFVPIRKAAEIQGVATLLHLRPLFGFDWQDLSSYTGPAAVVVVPIGAGKVGVACVFPTSKQPTDRLFAAGRAYFRDRGFEESTETLRGAKVSVFSPAAKSQSASRPIYLIAESVAVAASDRDVAVAIWDQFSGKAKLSLAAVKEFSDFAAPQSSATAAPVRRWWGRPLDTCAAIQSGPPANPRSDWLGIARRQGFNAIRAVRGEFAFPTSGPTDFDLRGQVLVTQPLTKAAKLLDLFATPPLAIPSWLDDNIASVSLSGCNVPEAVAAFGHIFDELNEPGPTGQGVFQDMLAGLREDPEGPKVDLLRDLFPHLGPAMLQASDCVESKVKGKNRENRRTMLVLQCRNHDAVAKTLTQFYNADEAIRRQKTEQGTLWTIGEGRSLLFEGSEGEASGKSTFDQEISSNTVVEIRAILLTDKTVVLATDPEMVTSRLSSRSGAGLNRSAMFEAVEKWWTIDEKRADRDLGFVRSSIWLKPSYDAVIARSPTGDWAAAALRLLFTGSQKHSANFPVEKLPAFVKISPSLPTVGSVREKNAGGWEIRMSTMRGASARP